GHALCCGGCIICDFHTTLGRRWSIRIICLLTLFIILLSNVIAATPPIPGGVFALIKAGAPTGSSVLSNPDVDGISLRQGWSAINPSENSYNWSYFDTEVAKAKNAGKKVLISLVCGGQSVPVWVRTASGAAGEP